MDLDLKAIRCFVMLAEELNFSRAADRLHLTQPALSSQIRVLERRLGVILFNRTTRHVAITDAGRDLLPAARELTAAGRSLASAVETLHGQPQRRLSFGAAFYTIDIPERVRLLETFLEAHGEAPLNVTPAWQSELVHDLQRGALDIALLIGVAISRAEMAREIELEPAVEIVFPDDLPRLVLRRERVALLLPRESSLADHAEVRRDALRGQRVALLGPNHGRAVIGPIRGLLERSGAQIVIPPEPHAIGVERYGRQFRMPAVSLGWFQTGRPEDDMVRRPIAGFTQATELALVHAPERLTGHAALFWDHAAELFGTLD